MNKILKKIIITIFIFSGVSSFSQIYNTYELESKINQNNDKYGNQISAVYYSWIGLDSTAITTFSKNRIRPQIEIKYNFTNFELIDAIEYISQISVNYDIIIINEAHHKSYDRKIIENLIIILSKNGYKNYFMEGFFNNTKTKERGFPIKSDGFYVKDPEYANSIRTALKLKYNIFGYECSDPLDCPTPNLREQCQAENIYDILLTNNEKSIIHCGFSHARIDDKLSDSWGNKAMARRLIESLPNKKILTIDQVELSDNIINNKKSYNEIIKNFAVEKPSFLKKNTYIFQDTLNTNKRYSLQIIQPPFPIIKKGKHKIVLRNKRKGYLFVYDKTEFNSIKKKEDLIPKEVIFFNDFTAFSFYKNIFANNYVYYNNSITNYYERIEEENCK